MIDLETMGTRFDAPILSIGAVFFNPATGKLGDTFYASVDIESALEHGKLSGATLKWWMGQGDAARKSAVEGVHTLPRALDMFATWYRGGSGQPAVWGNGATFDISILEYAYMKSGQPVPWPYYNVRDCRTIKDIGSCLNVDTAVTSGVAHNALDDAVSQAKWVSAIWQGLIGGAPSRIADSFDDLG
jgi:hypothetical protein